MATTMLLLALLMISLPTHAMAWCLGHGARTNCIGNSRFRNYGRMRPRGHQIMMHSRHRVQRTCAVSLNAYSTTSAPANGNELLANVNQTSTAANEDAIPPSTLAKHTMHLLSLPPTNDTFSLPGESLIRECWRWKDSALGDGRDYFVPRPRALKAFHSLFVGMEISVTFGSNDINAGQKQYHSSLEVVLKFPRSEGGQSAVEVKFPLSQYSNGASFYDEDLQSQKEISFSETFLIEECVAVSNCARFDVILVLSRIKYSDNGENNDATKEAAEIAASYAVVYHLQQQIASQRSKNKSILESTGLASWLDLPSAINLENDQAATNSIGEKQFEEMHQLAQRLTSMEGAISLSNYLSLIAGGLAPRPNRPDREVIFRPYSSRDAHILLQLKRTVEVVSVLNAKDDMDGQGQSNIAKSGGQGRLKTLLDGALSAGKAARNEEVVPEIRQLKEYGSDGTPPVALANVVAKAAIERAVKPLVAASVARLSAMETDTAEQIAQMRQRVNSFVASIGSKSDGMTENKTSSIKLQKMANRLLHAPTMQLREGTLSREDANIVVSNIEKQLVDQSNKG